MPSRTIYGDILHAKKKRKIFEIKKNLNGKTKLKKKKRSTTTALEFESLVQRNLGASAGMDFSGLARVLKWGCRRAERRLKKLKLLLEGGEKGHEEEKLLFAARVSACRFDATRAAAVSRGLEEALCDAEPPAFVSAAILGARRAAERALEAAASAEEALGGLAAKRES